MSTTTNRAALKILIALAVVAMAGLAFAGTAVATDHVDVLDGDDTDVIEDFSADDDQYIEYTLAADGADFGEDGTDEVAINVSYEGIDHYENTSIDVEDADADYTFNLSHADLETVPGDALETTTVNVTAWGEDDEGDTTTTPSEFEVDIEFAEDRSTVFLDEDASAFDDVDVEEPEEPGLFSLDTLTFWSDSDDEVDTYGLDTDVMVANDTTVHVFTEDADDGFSDAADAYDSDETPILGQTVVLDGELVPLYYGEAADFQDNESAHGVYEEGELRVYNADEVADPDDDDNEEVDMEYASANALHDVVAHDLEVDDVRDVFDDELSVGDLREEFSIRDIGIIEWAMSGAWVPFMVLGLAAPVAYRRRNAGA